MLPPSAVLDAAPVGVAVLRPPALACEVANPAFLALLGASGALGRPLAELHPGVAELLAPGVESVARDAAPVDLEDVAIPSLRPGDPARRRLTFRLRALPPDLGRGRAVLVVAQDVAAGAATGRLEALANLAGELAGDGAARAVLDRVPERARDVLGADAAVLLVADGEGGDLRGQVEVGGVRAEVTAAVGALPVGARAIASGQPVVLALEAAEGLEAVWLRAPGRATAVAAPLSAPGGAVGLLYARWQAAAFSRALDVPLVAAVASVCSLQVQRARMRRREHEARLASSRATERLELLAESGAILTSAVDWQAVVRTTAQLGLGYLADVAVLDLVGEDGVLRRAAMERGGDPADQLPLVEEGREVPSPAIHEALASRRTRRLVLPAGGAPLESDDEALARLAALGATSCIAAPLVIRGRAAGVLTLVRKTPSPPHASEDVALATEIARRAALALDDARLVAAAAGEAAARDAFLAAAAHDIRSPLTALQLQVEALERSGAVAESGRARLGRLRRSVGALTRRVEQVLDAARVGPGTELAREPLDLGQVAREAVEAVEPRVGGAAVRVVAPAPVPGRWDRARVEGLVANLVAVAAKRGGDTVEVRVTPEPRGGRIEVYRPGAEEDAAAPHGRVAAAYEELEVGVWIARRLAHAHGGQLRVERLPRLGARFTVELPG